MNSGLYGERIKELAGLPSRRLEAPQATLTLDNPLCGDTVSLDVTLSDGTATDVGHAVKGCLLCKAAATVVAGKAPGMDGAAARRMLEQVSGMLKAGDEPAFPDLAVFVPVRPHKSRHDCVLLPFKALAKAFGP